MIQLQFHVNKLITCLIISLCCLVLGSTSVAQQADEKEKLVFSSNHPLYLSDGSKYNFDQIEFALDKVFSYNKPVVLLVHGRGNEPNKSLNGGFFVEGKAVHKLEQQYNVKVLLFNWNSKAFFIDRHKPLKNIPAAAESFSIVLERIQSYLKHATAKKISLLVHSMGSIVMQKYVESYGWNYNQRIFNNVLFSEPDADNKNHASWVDKIAAVEKVYITINRNDFILSLAFDARKNGNRALGKKPLAPFSQLATYLDFTRLGKKANRKIRTHDIFNKNSMLDQLNICEIIHALLVSKNPDISKNTDPTSIPNYFKFKFERNRECACFNSANSDGN